MKKFIWIFVFCFIFCLCSCDISGKFTFYSVVVIDDGDVIDSRAVVKGSQYTLPRTRNKEGFQGWKVGNSSELLLSGNKVKITSDTTITAVREEVLSPVYCSVVVLSKGNVIESKAVLKDSDYILPSSPDGTGFKGWRIGDDEILKDAKSSIKITADTQITAEWNETAEAEYCSVVVLNKGELLESRILLLNSIYTLPDTPVGTGFRGWRVGDSEALVKSRTSVKITSDITITAVWDEAPVFEPTYYAVAVVDNGSIVDAVAVKAGESYILPAPSSRPGYFFNGWKVGESSSFTSVGESTTIIDNTTIKADWTAIYTLTVEVPQNVTNEQMIIVAVDTDRKMAVSFEDYTGVNNGYYQYAFSLLNLSVGNHTVEVSAASSGVTKTTLLTVDADADKTITVRLADKSEVIDLSGISISSTAKVDANYKLYSSTTINVPDGVYIYYTTDGSVADVYDRLYQKGTTINLDNGVTLNTYATTSGIFITGARNSSFFIDLSTIGAIGPAGGIIFYDKSRISNGWRMLEAGKSTLSNNYQWGSYTTAVSTLAGIGYGKSNTAQLINAMNSDSSLSFPAAEAVWKVDVYGNGYTDWFIPSISEMSEMYPVLKSLGLAGPLSRVGSCWSSTSSGGFDAMYTYMDNGSQNNMSRKSGIYVWPIRQF